MKNIELIKEFDFSEKIKAENNIELKELFNGLNRRIVEVKLTENKTLSKHKAAEPITIFCLSGNGTFFAGKDLEEKQTLKSGTLITLEAEIEHAVIAEPEIHILVTKFKNDNFKKVNK